MAKPCILYDYMRLVTQQNKVTMDPNQLASRLANLGIEHAEVIQVFIFHHSFSNGHTEAVPYSGRLLTKTHGIQYNLNNIPPDLKDILVAYLENIKA